jgi:anaphase-promoting complex subunit 4
VAPKASHGGFGNWDGGSGDNDDDEGETYSKSDSKYETVCFHAGASTPGGRHVVGVLGFHNGVPEKALAVEVPAGQEVVDAVAYTKGRVLALCQPAGGATFGANGAAGGPASVVMLDTRSGRGGGSGGFVALEGQGTLQASGRAAPPPPGCAPASSIVSVSFQPGDADATGDGAAPERPPRRRTLPGLEATAPLAVGTRKGLAAVLVGTRRIVLLDLEEDESDEDESDEDEDGE